MFQNFCHVFNFDCGFTHVSHIWPDAEFIIYLFIYFIALQMHSKITRMVGTIIRQYDWKGDLKDK